MPILIVEYPGPRRGAKLPPRVLVGRRSMNHLVVDHPDVSRMHAWIDRVGGDFVLTDMRSRTGTTVNGRRLPRSRALVDGDVIAVGPTKLTFLAADRLPAGVEPFEIPRLPVVSHRDVGVRFDCPHCRAPMWAAPQFAGHFGSCVYCGEEFTVPGGPAGPDGLAVATPPPPSATPPRPAGVTAGLRPTTGLAAAVATPGTSPSSADATAPGPPAAMVPDVLLPTPLLPPLEAGDLPLFPLAAENALAEEQSLAAAEASATVFTPAAIAPEPLAPPPREPLQVPAAPVPQSAESRARPAVPVPAGTAADGTPRSDGVGPGRPGPAAARKAVAGLRSDAGTLAAAEGFTRATKRPAAAPPPASRRLDVRTEAPAAALPVAATDAAIATQATPGDAQTLVGFAGGAELERPISPRSGVRPESDLSAKVSAEVDRNDGKRPAQQTNGSSRARGPAPVPQPSDGRKPAGTNGHGTPLPPSGRRVRPASAAEPIADRSSAVVTAPPDRPAVSDRSAGGAGGKTVSAVASPAVAAPAVAAPAVAAPPRPPAAAPAVATPSKLRCGVCQSAIEATEAQATCPSCGLHFHDECWHENYGCSAYGCPQVNALAPPEVDADGATADEHPADGGDLSDVPPPPRTPWEFVLLGGSVLAAIAGAFTFGAASLAALVAGVVYLARTRRDPDRRTAVVAAAVALSAVGVAAGAATSYFLFVYGRR
jgi:hypothetical protein